MFYYVRFGRDHIKVDNNLKVYKCYTVLEIGEGCSYNDKWSILSIPEINSFPGTHLLDPTVQVDVKYEEICLVFFILFLWAVVLRIFFQRWGKFSFILFSLQLHLHLHHRQDQGPPALPACLQQGDGGEDWQDWQNCQK